jgi:hypothetical protein
MDPPSPSDDPLLLKGRDLEAWLEKNRGTTCAMDYEVYEETSAFDLGDSVEGFDWDNLSTTSPRSPSRSAEQQLTKAIDFISRTDDEAEDGSSDDDEGADDLGVVKITSDDPKAAARAAAILKLVSRSLI